ncbi:kunitz-type protease inhibitor 3 [Peromyscus californicus insignis]|uniref:kunitz-type protease inhibitor 3 n=1 Tax=Peromyscus californicus insignis TaxID=564181 RepID=UPI0022A7E4C7|nr:kunitz-type protease inhibitor 3 [Peromyscus californicus insignis]
MQLQASFSFFLILTFCQELCSEPRRVSRKPLPPLCSLPVEKGQCQAMVLRWYYSTKSGRCERFGYGGCGGNENNFLNRNECRLTCRRS